MIRTVLSAKDASAGDTLTWIDVSAPSRSELTELAARYNLHVTSVEDSLEPLHQPKHETIGDAHFLILRAYDVESGQGEAAGTARQLTRKVAFFIVGKTLITITRQELQLLAPIRAAWEAKKPKGDSLPHLLNDIIRAVLDTYEKPIADLQSGLSALETVIFKANNDEIMLQDGYHIRRRASVFHHILSLTSDLIATLADIPKASKPYFQDLKEKADRLAFYADDIRDNVDHLLNLHISLAAQNTNKASQRVNEIMRLLAVFSAFFLPLNFIASIYGMNFQFMPELQSPIGYYRTLGIMLLIAVGIFLWFKRKGWLKPEKIE